MPKQTAKYRIPPLHRWAASAVSQAGPACSMPYFFSLASGLVLRRRNIATYAWNFTTENYGLRVKHLVQVLPKYSS